MNMLRKFILPGLLAIACTAVGQNYNAEKVDRPNTKKINIGIKAGFNSSMFMVSELKIKDVTIDEVQNNYKIGYFGALFMRINMKKHFIQPEVSYNVSKCEITFDKLGSQHPAIEPDYASVQSVLHSVDFPILYGYNVVKKGPYGMSIFAGPKLRYLWGKHYNAEKVDRPNTKKINIGIKAGFNSSMFMVSELKIKDVTIDEVQNNYKIGYFGALFMRINMKKHFIQPEVSYNVSKCEITFDKLGSQHPAIEPDYASVQSVLHSVDFPILYGYNVVKKGPYGMSIFAGPKLRYLWGKHNEITFKNFDQKGIHERLYPFNVSAVIGVGVNISRIFFDFRYEQGIGNISKSIIYDNINSDGSTGVSNIIFRRRDSALSFSLGFIL